MTIYGCYTHNKLNTDMQIKGGGRDSKVKNLVNHISIKYPTNSTK